MHANEVVREMEFIKQVIQLGVGQPPGSSGFGTQALVGEFLRSEIYDIGQLGALCPTFHQVALELARGPRARCDDLEGKAEHGGERGINLGKLLLKLVDGKVGGDFGDQTNEAAGNESRQKSHRNEHQLGQPDHSDSVRINLQDVLTFNTIGNKAVRCLEQLRLQRRELDICDTAIFDDDHRDRSKRLMLPELAPRHEGFGTNVAAGSPSPLRGPYLAQSLNLAGVPWLAEDCLEPGEVVRLGRQSDLLADVPDITPFSLDLESLV